MGGRKIRNMEEFAAVSGISRPTVSKYFNDPASVRATTRQRIEAALEDYDYRPNIFAVNQNRRLTKNIGIVVPYLADPFFAEIARNLERRCIDAGFSPILFSSHGVTDYETDILEALRALKPAGVLLAPLGRSSDKKALEAFCRDVPTVLFDSYIKDLGEAFVGHNNAQATALICEYLCRTGAPPCFFEMRTPTNPNAIRRRQTYCDVMEGLGHEPRLVQVEGESWDFEEVGYQEGKRVISENLLPTDTVLCSNDRLAIGFLSAAYETGRHVGRGANCALRVAGHDNHPFSKYTSPPLTTISQDYTAIAHQSVATLFDVIESGSTENQQTQKLFDGQLIMRESA
ncbi:MAG: LacI family DNA-binding transcriptional regulator [Pseudomonadota bacterium]